MEEMKMGRYFRHMNNAQTVTGRGGAMSRQSLFGFGGFGQTDPVLDAPPGEADVAADVEEQVDAVTADAVVAADAAATAATEPVSTITFYPDGTWYTTTPLGNRQAVEWTDAMAAALGTSKLATAHEMLAKARSKASGMWMWAALLGIPAAGAGAWFAHKRWGR